MIEKANEICDGDGEAKSVWGNSMKTKIEDEYFSFLESMREEEKAVATLS